jgi:four helix bundle protein
MARDLAVQLHGQAGTMEKRGLYRYAEQLRAAGLSLPNNIAEGSGSIHAKEFKQYLNIARRSLFEDASMLLVFDKMGLLETPDVDRLLTACDHLSRKITLFGRTLE